MTFYDKLAKFPPILIRLLARHPNGKPFTIEEISARSGLSKIEVLTLGQSTDWRDVDPYTILAYTRACRVDLEKFEDINRCRCYLRGSNRGGKRRPPSFMYLRRSENWISEFEPLIVLWLKTRSAK